MRGKAWQFGLVGSLAISLGCRPEGGTVSPEPTPSTSEETREWMEEERNEDENTEQAMLQIEGGLTEAQVKEVIDEHFTDIRTCFDLALAQPDGVDLTGAIVVLMHVDATGKTTETTLESSTFGDDATHDCIVERTASWTFPAPKGKKPTTLHVPFHLRSY